MQIISNMALLSINETMVIQLGSFLIFVFLLNRIMIKPLTAEIGHRDVYIDKIEQDIIAAKKKLADINAQIKEGKDKARAEASAITTEFKQMGTLEAADIMKIAMDDVMDINVKAESEIELEIMNAKKFLKKESEAIALGIMEKILDRRLG